jgi:short-subunit dehydrogenase
LTTWWRCIKEPGIGTLCRPEHRAENIPSTQRPTLNLQPSYTPNEKWHEHSSSSAQAQAAHFATAGINHIILLARNSQRLEDSDAPFVRAASPDTKVSTVALDLADLDSIPGVLKQLDELTEGEDVEVIFFNAARIKASDVLNVDVREIEEDFKVCLLCCINVFFSFAKWLVQTSVLSLYIIAQHYIPHLLSLAKQNKSTKPALLVTNSHLPWDPAPQLLSLGLNKAAQRNMVQSFARAYEGSGVQIGLVSVEGVVAPENKVLNPTTIAERAVGFWESGGKGEEEVTVHVRE